MADTRAAEALARALREAGFEADSNVCAACVHHGGDHDLGNWCLKCPRPQIEGPHTFSQRIDAGWCYFASHADRGWGVGVAAVLAHPFTDSERAALVAALLDGHEDVLAGALASAGHDCNEDEHQEDEVREFYAAHAVAAVAAIAAAGKEPTP